MKYIDYSIGCFYDVFDIYRALTVKEKPLQYSYLNTPEALEELATNKASRKFFEDFQGKKSKIIKTMADKSPDEISAEVSSKILKYWEKYNTIKNDKENSIITEQQEEQKGNQVLDAAENQNDKGSAAANELDQGHLDGNKKELGLNPDSNNSENALATGIPASEKDKEENQETDFDDVKDVIKKYNDMFSADQNASITSKQTRVIKIGEELISLGKGELNPETFYTELRKLAFELLTMVSDDSKENKEQQHDLALEGSYV